MLELERNANAPSIARAAMNGRCAGLELSPAICQTLVLLVSEVVTNAVLHSSAPTDAPILLTTNVTDDTIHVTVTDRGDSFNRRAHRQGRRFGGYGLHIVEKTTSRWGVDRAGGTRVWFELSRTV